MYFCVWFSLLNITYKRFIRYFMYQFNLCNIPLCYCTKVYLFSFCWTAYLLQSLNTYLLNEYVNVQSDMRIFLGLSPCPTPPHLLKPNSSPLGICSFLSLLKSTLASLLSELL